ncbi:uncharacterized protein GGS25DRAFT_496655 [Hypoxylon fragiforme]|uniref:uncharacterized protein n=1 Tax=Hypoxylon fragiforme TaxID=63214 RepID=UPI0020C6F036|nr:uncharacterized protein GGS25DRAFT_496655 [Hypoxylon fragiforme]KAI2607586.1 hypothetical protein GGS25DRAFT_496655 [Hypoxylon fragiforme]
MPVPVFAKAGVIALSVAVVAAVAVYESPEVRRFAANLRRRIAIALHLLGDNISPAERQNLFNRPEDAAGFFESRGINLDDVAGVDADDETRRRQREELMYWNALREEKEKGTENEKRGVSPPGKPRRGSSFDDFLRQDNSAEKGTYVFQTGSEAQNTEGLVRRRGEGARGLTQSVYTNPFTDEHGIDEHIVFENSLMDPEKDEFGSDIYSASTQFDNKPELSRTVTLSPEPAVAIPQIANVDDQTPTTPIAADVQASERELGHDEFMTAGQDDRQDAYSSIQAWAHDASTASFYSPLPVSPASVSSEPELISDGILTPTDSASLAGSGEDIGEAASARSWTDGRPFDVMSDDEGMMTPASWTEVGSVVSESDTGVAHQ